MSTSAHPVTPTLNVDNTLGALLIGGVLALALWGFVCYQVLTFFRDSTSDTKDSPRFRATVALLWVLDTIGSFLIAHILYTFMVTNHLNPTPLSHSFWSLRIYPTISAIHNFLVRLMYILRFYTLCHSIPFSIVMVIVSTVNLLDSIALTVMGLVARSFQKTIKFQHPLYYLNIVSDVASDACIFIGLTAVLCLAKSKFQRTNSLLMTLTIYIANSGLLLVLAGLASAIIYTVLPNSLVYVGVWLILPKIYINAYLSMLNARKELRIKFNDPDSSGILSLSLPITTHRSSVTTDGVLEGTTSNVVIIPMDDIEKPPSPLSSIDRCVIKREELDGIDR